jgi:hypothetical protein
MRMGLEGEVGDDPGALGYRGAYLSQIAII